MSAFARLTIHCSQFPGSVRRDLLNSLRTRQVNHKFHYDSVKQTIKWLALHEAYSPARTDPDCAAVYDRGFQAVVAGLKPGPVHLISLGCGGGQKDVRLLKLLRDAGREVYYTPADVSAAMVLVAREAALPVIGEEACFPFVCDLATADDLPQALDNATPQETASHSSPPEQRGRAASRISRLFAFFGMLPNFEPEIILPRLSALLAPGDALLLSANLAPGPDYAAGVQRILPLYDNDLTRDWLVTFLLDLGVEKDDGEVRFAIEDGAEGTGLLRVVARFHFTRPREIAVDSVRFEFLPGDSIRLFFSYRHTPSLVQSLLGRERLEVRQEWITQSEEEGVFLVTATGA